GIWRDCLPLHGEILTPEESAEAARLARMTYTNMKYFRYTRSQRARVLDTVLRYYSLHVTPLSGLRSLEILRSMF
ncbi:MAG: DNA repair protein RecO, partial [Duncaniella sp.]|nr:DNA repair protein RecO [Duncaniella sp.]